MEEHGRADRLAALAEACRALVDARAPRRTIAATVAAVAQALFGGAGSPRPCGHAATRSTASPSLPPPSGTAQKRRRGKKKKKEVAVTGAAESAEKPLVDQVAAETGEVEAEPVDLEAEVKEENQEEAAALAATTRPPDHPDTVMARAINAEPNAQEVSVAPPSVPSTRLGGIEMETMTCGFIDLFGNDFDPRARRQLLRQDAVAHLAPQGH